MRSDESTGVEAAAILGRRGLAVVGRAAGRRPRGRRRDAAGAAAVDARVASARAPSARKISRPPVISALRQSRKRTQRQRELLRLIWSATAGVTPARHALTCTIDMSWFGGGGRADEPARSPAGYRDPPQRVPVPGASGLPSRPGQRGPSSLGYDQRFESDLPPRQPQPRGGQPAYGQQPPSRASPSGSYGQGSLGVTNCPDNAAALSNVRGRRPRCA